MITIRRERQGDSEAREALLDDAYGPARFTKTSARLRDGRIPADDLSFVAVERGRVVGTVRLWHISLGRERPALMLGPLVVHTDYRRRGIGAALVRRAIRDTAGLGHRAVLLVGDLSYYARFGFSAEKTGALWLPGSFDPSRLLALDLVQGALDGALGLVVPSGQRERQPKPTELVAKPRVHGHQAVARAA
jgi:predicted N-acetyltransferase YhbS